MTRLPSIHPLRRNPPSRLRKWVRIIHRVRLDYRRYFGRNPSLLRPRRFTEKMQWRKLFELDPAFAVLTDKLAARDFVAARIGPGHQPALLWVGDDPDTIPFDDLVPPYVLKPTHSSGDIVIVRDNNDLDTAAIRATARTWLAHCHGSVASEPAYIHLPRRLIAERLLVGIDGAPPHERKVYVFNGRVAFIRTNTCDAMGELLFGALHTRDWTRLPMEWGLPAHPVPMPKPACLAEIIAFSEHLGAGMSHCRVDIYDCGDVAIVGELTLYSASGLVHYDDDATDFALGEAWRISWPMLRALWTVAFRRWEIRPPQS